MLLTLWAVEQAGLLDGLPLSALNGLGVVGVVLVVGWMIATGRLVTRREVSGKDDEIRDLRAANANLRAQNLLMLREAVPATNAVMNALHQALENEEH